MYDVITAPHSSVQNVTEWSKRDLCWERAREKLAQLPIDSKFAEGLVSVAELNEAAREAKDTRKVDDGIDAQTEVVKLGFEYWKRVDAWSAANHPVSPDERTILRVASGYTYGVPTDRQAKRLLALKERLELEGMAPPDALL
jgi:hypothetical protein